MNIELTTKQFRRLLDMVYIGNWVLNSARGEDRFKDYDEVESLIFSHCHDKDMDSLFEVQDGEIVPSREFVEGGIHEAILAYEDSAFFEILAEELARRDMGTEPITLSDFDELSSRMDEYMDEFEQNGIDNIRLDNQDN